MLKVIELSRRQAFSAGLVAGAFFSAGCTDEERLGGIGPDADVGDEECADQGPVQDGLGSIEAEAGQIRHAAARTHDRELPETWTPVVTALPDDALEQPNHQATEIRLRKPKSGRRRPALRVEPHLVIQTVPEVKDAGAPEGLGKKRERHKAQAEPLRESVMGDNYAAFGANDMR